MAIKAGWVGSSAVSETGQRWMSAAMQAVRLSRPAYMSAMVGRSKEINYSIGASNSYNKDTLINWMKSQGSTPVVITITGNLVSHSAGVPCLDFPSSLTNEYVTLIINSGVTVYGRGGNGGSGTGNGAAGGTAINNAIGTRLRITNNGAIAGGGGGGGGGAYDAGYQGYRCTLPGGGGRPFGAAGGGYSWNMQGGGTNATAGTISAAGKGGNGAGLSGGNGGNVGAAGAAASSNMNKGRGSGGAAGKAVTGNAPRWDKVGTIYGARV